MTLFLEDLQVIYREVHERNRLILKGSGYSNAIDMWSIGSIAAVLLTGDVLFVDRERHDFEYDPLEVILSLSAQCDVSMIDDPENATWARIGKRPKALVKALLVLDESRRLTAKQALQDLWFTKSIYAAEFDAVYQRAISDWAPPEPKDDLVRFIESSDLGPLPTDLPDDLDDLHNDSLAQKTKSQYFGSARSA